MRTCPKCSLVNPDSAIVCDCGHVIDADAAKSVPGDALRSSEPPRRQPPPFSLAAKVLVGLVGYVCAGVFYGLVCALLKPVITFPVSLMFPAGIAGSVLALKLLDGGYGEADGRPPPRRRNYFVRHWRGELSLGVSYWVNGWLMAFVVLCASGVINGSARSSDSPYAPIVAGVSVWIVAAAGELWCFVGTWRSANRPTPGGWISSWAGPAKAALVIGSTLGVAVFVSQGWPALGAALKGARAASRANDGTTANATSGAKPPTDAEVEAMLDGAAVYRAIKATNPDAHAELVRQVRARLARGDSLADIRNDVRAVVMPIFTKALPDASDEALRHLAEVQMKEVAELEQVAPDLCAGGATERANDVAAQLSPELVKEKSEVIERVIASAASGRRTVDANRARTLFERALRHARAAATPGSDARSACRNARALYAAVLALPAQDSADLLRAMLTRPEDFAQAVRRRPHRRPTPPAAPELSPPGRYRLRLGSDPFENPG